LLERTRFNKTWDIRSKTSISSWYEKLLQHCNNGICDFRSALIK